MTTDAARPATAGQGARHGPWLVAATLGLVAGAAVARLAEATIVSLALALLAPALWGGALLATIALVALRRSRAALGLLAGATCVLAPLEASWLAPPVPPDDALAVHTVDCPPATPPEHFDVVLWNTHGLDRDDDLAAVAAALRPADVVVLLEIAGAPPTRELAALLGGEGAQTGLGHSLEHVLVADRETRAHGPAIIAVDATLERCGGVAATAHALPGIGTRVPRGIVTRVRGVPIFGFHLDRPRDLEEVLLWPGTLRRAAAQLAATAPQLGPYAVLAGDTNTTPRFHRFHESLRASGLVAADPVRTWPDHLDEWSAWPVVALDRVYVGASWLVTGVERFRPGTSDHLAVRVRLRQRP